MPVLESAQDFVEALDNINVLLACTTPLALGQLASMRVRVMKLLIIFLKFLDERCRQSLLSGITENKATARLIQKDVADLRLLINSHVTRWSPDTIRTDPAAYKIASDTLQCNIRNILARAPF